MNFTPLEDRILVRPVKKTEEEKTEGGLFIPSTVQKEIAEGIVVSVGAGRYAMETGVHVPNYLLPNDKVIYGVNQGMTIEVGGEELRIMREGDVLLVVSRAEKNQDEVSEN